MEDLLNLSSLALDTRARGGAHRTGACLQLLIESEARQWRPNPRTAATSTHTPTGPLSITEPTVFIASLPTAASLTQHAASRSSHHWSTPRHSYTISKPSTPRHTTCHHHQGNPRQGHESPAPRIGRVQWINLWAHQGRHNQQRGRKSCGAAPHPSCGSRRPALPPPPSGRSPPPYCQAGWCHLTHCHQQSLLQSRRAVRPCSLPGSRKQLVLLEVCVGVRGGSQIDGHSLRAGIAANPGCVTVQIDWWNAFSTLCRGRSVLPGPCTPGDMGLQAAQPPASPPGVGSHHPLPEQRASRRPPGTAALCTCPVRATQTGH
jgi:hypothetical protein